MGNAEKTIAVQVPLYGLEALYLACYAFLDRAYLRLEGDPKACVQVRLRAKNGDGAALDSVAGEFENELLHQALRTRITAANQKIREHIITRALASAQGYAPETAESCDCGASGEGTPLAEEAVLDADLEKEVDKLLAEVEKEGGEDPLNIAAPWEESHPAGAAPAPAPAKKGGAKPKSRKGGKRDAAKV